MATEESWTVDTDHGIHVVDATYRRVVGHVGGLSEHIRLTRGRLLAAAPDLLRELTALVERCEDSNIDTSDATYAIAAATRFAPDPASIGRE